MMFKAHFIIPVLLGALWISCGSDTRELAADEPVSPLVDTIQPAKPDNALTQALETVPEMSRGFQTKDFDQDGTHFFGLDTGFVRKHKIVSDNYVFEEGESWNAVGKMVTDDYILLFVNYKNPGADNVDLYVFNLSGKPLSSMPLSIQMAPEGQAPVEGRVNPEGLVSVTFKEKGNLVKKDFEITGENGEFKLVKSVQLPK